MIALTVGKDVPGSSWKPYQYCIRLKISPADREDAWDLCRVAVHYGGVEVHNCCFAFPNEERWLSALEALRFRFGRDYFEADWRAIFCLRERNDFRLLNLNK